MVEFYIEKQILQCLVVKCFVSGMTFGWFDLFD